MRLKYGLFGRQNLLSGKEFFNQYFEFCLDKDKANIARTKFSSYVNFLANLTSVDGALVLSDCFSLHGFGAEILLRPENIKIENPFSNSHGMRHRSAYYFVDRVPNSLAIVMSQDGGNKVIYKSLGEVKIIQDYEKERLDLLL